MHNFPLKLLDVFCFFFFVWQFSWICIVKRKVNATVITAVEIIFFPFSFIKILGYIYSWHGEKNCAGLLLRKPLKATSAFVSMYCLHWFCQKKNDIFLEEATVFVENHKMLPKMCYSMSSATRTINKNSDDIVYKPSADKGDTAKNLCVFLIQVI